MANEVFLNDDGIIEVHATGVQTEASVRSLVSDVEHLGNSCRHDDHPVLVLDNIQRMGDISEAGRKVVVEFGKSSIYDKLAMVGSGVFLRLGANLLIGAIGKESKVRYFEDEAAATRWLLA